MAFNDDTPKDLENQLLYKYISPIRVENANNSSMK